MNEDSLPDWASSEGRFPFRLAVCSFGILALELATIRWMSGQILVAAYFQNFVLIAAFLGMGLGVALGRKHPMAFHKLLPALVVLSVVLTFSEELGLMHLRFPDLTFWLWGSESKTTLAQF